MLRSGYPNRYLKKRGWQSTDGTITEEGSNVLG